MNYHFRDYSLERIFWDYDVQQIKLSFDLRHKNRLTIYCYKSRFHWIFTWNIWNQKWKIIFDSNLIFQKICLGRQSAKKNLTTDVSGIFRTIFAPRTIKQSRKPCEPFSELFTKFVLVRIVTNWFHTKSNLSNTKMFTHTIHALAPKFVPHIRLLLNSNHCQTYTRQKIRGGSGRTRIFDLRCIRATF